MGVVEGIRELLRACVGGDFGSGVDVGEVCCNSGSIGDIVKTKFFDEWGSDGRKEGFLEFRRVKD